MKSVTAVKCIILIALGCGAEQITLAQHRVSLPCSPYADVLVDSSDGVTNASYALGAGDGQTANLMNNGDYITVSFDERFGDRVDWDILIRQGLGSGPFSPLKIEFADDNGQFYDAQSERVLSAVYADVPGWACFNVLVNVRYIRITNMGDLEANVDEISNLACLGNATSATSFNVTLSSQPPNPDSSCDPPPPPPPPPGTGTMPSLSSYGLIVLVLLLAGTGIWLFRRKMAV